MANKYVHDRRKINPKASIFWITARSEDEIKTGFQAIADQLMLEIRVESLLYEQSKQLQPEEPGQRAVDTSLELVNKWLCSPLHEGWLLVLDNYDDVRVDIRAFLPAGIRGSVLITSRDRKVIGSVAKSGLALSAMDANDARQLFLDIQDPDTRNLRNKATAHPEADVLEDILKELQCFPLAIDQAASFIRENSPMTFREYLEYLKPRSIDRERLLRFKQANPLYPESVMTTWEISLEYLERTQPRACKILQILGFLNQDHIAEDLLTTTTKDIPWLFESPSLPKRLPDPFRTHMQYLQDDVGFRVAIGTLVSFSLIRRDPAGPTLQVHPLVHEWIRVRLNTEPEQQARLTICTTLILYQSFPVELVAWVLDESPGWSDDVFHRVDRVAHHIINVLQNLRDYQTHAETLPLECFVLCETLILAQAPNHSVRPLGKSNKFSADLDRVIRAMIPCLTQYQQPIALVIHKIVVWLRSRSWSGGSLTSLHEIIDALKALLPTFPVANSAAPFWLLLVTLATDVSRCVSYREKRSEGSAKGRSSAGMSSQWIRTEDSDITQDERYRRIHIRLFKALKPIASTNSPSSSFHQWVSMIIDLRIVNILNPWEFASQTYLNVTQVVSSSALRYIPFEQRGACLCNLTQLLWEYPEARDFESLRAVLSSAMSESKAELKRERRALTEQQDSEVIEAWSHSSYISSSWGRSTGKGAKREIKRDFVGPMGYIWGIATDVAKAISDPKVCWRTSPNNHGDDNYLNLEQRRWAVELIRGFGELRATISKAFTASDGRLLDKFRESNYNVALSVIYGHLEDWPMLRVCLSKTLQFESIVKFCDLLHPRPWVYAQVSRRWEEPQEPASARPTDQAVGGSTGSPDNAMLVASVALLQRDIPDSWRCICTVGVEEAIAAAIVLVEKEVNLPPAEISNLQRHLSALPGIDHDLSRYLSRLEIIYKLAYHLPIKPSTLITRSRPIPIKLSTGQESRRSPLEAWDDEQSDDLSDDSTDSVGFGNQRSPPEHHWGW